MKNFLMMNFVNIFFPSYQLKVLELTVIAEKSFYKYVLVVRTNLLLKYAFYKNNMPFIKKKTIKVALGKEVV